MPVDPSGDSEQPSGRAVTFLVPVTESGAVFTGIVSVLPPEFREGDMVTISNGNSYRIDSIFHKRVSAGGNEWKTFVRLMHSGSEQSDDNSRVDVNA